MPFNHVGPIVDPRVLPKGEFVASLQPASDSSLFFNAWDKVEDLTRSTVTPNNAPAQPATSDYDNDMIAISGDDCATLTPA